MTMRRIVELALKFAIAVAVSTMILSVLQNLQFIPNGLDLLITFMVTYVVLSKVRLA